MRIIKNFLSTIETSLTDELRSLWLFRLSVGGLLIGSWLSAGLWSSDRTYPLVPVFKSLHIPVEWHLILFTSSSLFLLISLLFKTHRRTTVSLGLSIFIFLIFLDITRLQPWIFHYLSILVLFGPVLVKKNFFQSHILDISRIIIVGIYFWSGIHKLNATFFYTTFPYLTEPIWSLFGQDTQSIFVLLGIMAPFIEASFAIGLLFKKTRLLSIVACGGMHTLILICIGPLGHNYNSSVWPWNIIIFLTVFVLFFGAKFNFSEFLSRVKGNKVALVAMFMFWIAPAGNYAGLTDHYLSWSLYSGRVPEVAILGNEELLHKLSPISEDGELRMIPWAIDDLNAVPYPEKRVFMEIFRDICTEHSERPLTLAIQNNSLPKSNFNSQRHYECDDI